MKKAIDWIRFRLHTVKRCSWCKSLIGLRSRILANYNPDAPVTDGICRSCMDRFNKAIHKKNQQQPFYH